MLEFSWRSIVSGDTRHSALVSQQYRALKQDWDAIVLYFPEIDVPKQRGIKPIMTIGRRYRPLIGMKVSVAQSSAFVPQALPLYIFFGS